MRPKRMRRLLRLGCRGWIGWAECAKGRAFACALGWVGLGWFMYLCMYAKEWEMCEVK